MLFHPLGRKTAFWHVWLFKKKKKFRWLFLHFGKKKNPLLSKALIQTITTAHVVPFHWVIKKKNPACQRFEIFSENDNSNFPCKQRSQRPPPGFPHKRSEKDWPSHAWMKSIALNNRPSWPTFAPSDKGGSVVLGFTRTHSWNVNRLSRGC